MTSRTESSPRTGWATSVALKHPYLLTISLCGLVCVMALWTNRPPVVQTTSALQQDVYVWQRSWSEDIRAAVQERSPRFGEVVVLVAEVAWKNGQPKVSRVKPDV